MSIHYTGSRRARALLEGRLKKQTESSPRPSRKKGECFPTILIDTGVLYAFADKNDEHNLDAKATMLRVLTGGLGSPIVIDYVMLEVITLLNQRRLSTTIRPLVEFLKENRFEMFFIPEQIFSEALELTIKSEQQKRFLSLTDSSQIVASKILQVQTIATFDSTLASFFQACIGKNYFDQLSEKERNSLSRARYDQ